MCKKWERRYPWPAAWQVLPTFQETVQVTGFVTDPLDEQHANPVKGIIHKYASRVLILSPGLCVVNCRYCFRQHFDYHENLPTQNDWQAIGAYITAHPAVNEVILSGGDPLSLSNRRLLRFSPPWSTTPSTDHPYPYPCPCGWFLSADEPLLARFANSRCHIVMVIHANHPNEIDQRNTNIFGLRQKAGIYLTKPCYSSRLMTMQIRWQANEKLCTRRASYPIICMCLKRSCGASHFYISDEQAVALYWELLTKCAGYLVPKLVRELPNKPFKTPIDLYNH